MGRILQRQRATLRRMRDHGVAAPHVVFESALDRLLAQWRDAAAASRDHVSLALGLSVDEIHDWLGSADELLLSMTDEEVMRRLGGPALSDSDASVLRGMIAHVARLTSAD